MAENSPIYMNDSSCTFCESNCSKEVDLHDPAVDVHGGVKHSSSGTDTSVVYQDINTTI